MKGPYRHIDLDIQKVTKSLRIDRIETIKYDCNDGYKITSSK
jgi:hypothetical protein